MQVEVDMKHMQTKFDGCNLSSFGDFAPLYFSLIFSLSLSLLARKLPPDCLTSLPAGASLLRQTEAPRPKSGCCGGGGQSKEMH